MQQLYVKLSSKVAANPSNSMKHTMHKLPMCCVVQIVEMLLIKLRLCRIVKSIFICSAGSAMRLQSEHLFAFGLLFGIVYAAIVSKQHLSIIIQHRS